MVADELLGNPEWYAQPDPNRKEWCFLFIETATRQNEKKIESIETGIGNSQNLLETNEQKIENRDNWNEEEQQLLLELKDFIDPLTRECSLVITAKKETIPLVRTRMLRHDIELSFRGLHHVSLRDLYATYFVYDADDIRFSKLEENKESPSGRSESSTVKDLWEAYKEIGCFIPRHALEGEPL